MRLAERIRKIRELHDLTQAEVANRCNISSSAYGQIERRAGSSSYETLQKVANAIGVSLPFLIDVDNEEFMNDKSNV